MKKSIVATLLGLAIVASAAPSFADRWRRDDRRDHRQDRREDRRERREDRRERRERREDRREWREDHRRAFRAPPALRAERYAPRRGYTWVSGRWDWNGNDYVWIGGRYEPERRGYRWRAPRWEQRDGVYVSVDGGWDALGPTMAPPTLREERWETRRGYVWIRGNWRWDGAQWAWVPGHYERERAGYIYQEPRYEEQGGVYVTVGGGWSLR